MAPPTTRPIRGVHVVRGRHSTPDFRAPNIGSGSSQGRPGNGNGGNTKEGAHCSQGLQSLAAQIMFLPPDEPAEGLQAMGSDLHPMHKDGYDHPVLVLTDPDEDGYVVFQKVGSCPCSPPASCSANMRSLLTSLLFS